MRVYPLSPLQQAILAALPLDPYHAALLPGHPTAVSRSVLTLERRGLLVRERKNNRTVALLAPAVEDCPTLTGGAVATGRTVHEPVQRG